MTNLQVCAITKATTLTDVWRPIGIRNIFFLRTDTLHICAAHALGENNNSVLLRFNYHHYFNCCAQLNVAFLFSF